MFDYNPIEIEWNELTDSLKIRVSRLNQREIQLANEYLDEIQHAKLGKEWTGTESRWCDECKKTHRILRLEWEKINLERQINGLTSKPRNKPYLLVNELSGKGLHKYQKHNGKLIKYPFWNVNRLCFSCNRKYHSTKGDDNPNRDDLPQVVILSRDGKKGLWKLIDNALVTATHICYEGVIWNFAEPLNLMPDTLKKYVVQRIGTLYELIDIADFRYSCNNFHCNGQHIIKKGFPPVVELDNYDAQQKEIKEEQLKLQSE